MVSDIVDIENISKALQDGPYGRCVYESDNDVMSHQVHVDLGLPLLSKIV